MALHLPADQRLIECKAEALRKAVIYVDPRHTSQRCSRCGNGDRRSRDVLRFRFTDCGYELHADLNAARNIASLGIAEAGRLPINEPNVASSCLHP